MALHHTGTLKQQQLRLATVIGTGGKESCVQYALWSIILQQLGSHINSDEIAGREAVNISALSFQPPFAFF